MAEKNSPPSDDGDPPALTREEIVECLRVGEERARKRLREMNAAHLRGYSRAMALRLD